MQPRILHEKSSRFLARFLPKPPIASHLAIPCDINEIALHENASWQIRPRLEAHYYRIIRWATSGQRISLNYAACKLKRVANWEKNNCGQRPCVSRNECVENVNVAENNEETKLKKKKKTEWTKMQVTKWTERQTRESHDIPVNLYKI